MSVAQGKTLQQGGRAGLVRRARAFLGPGPGLLLFMATLQLLLVARGWMGS